MTDTASAEFIFDREEAKGKVRVETGPFGLYIYVNDIPEPVALVDLFHCASEVSHHHDPQIITYDGDEALVFTVIGLRAIAFLEQGVKQFHHSRYGEIYAYPDSIFSDD